MLQANATPIFADIDPDTFQICPKSTKEKLSDRTGTVITVALYGGAPNLKEIRKIPDKFQLYLIG